MNHDPFGSNGTNGNGTSHDIKSTNLEIPVPAATATTPPTSTLRESNGAPADSNIDARKSKIVFGAKFHQSMSPQQNRPASSSTPPLPSTTEKPFSTSSRTTTYRGSNPGNSDNSLEILPSPSSKANNAAAHSAAASPASSAAPPSLPVLTTSATNSSSARAASPLAGLPISSTKKTIDINLLTAAIGGHLETIQKLIEEGANINTTDNNGENVVLLAARNGHKAVLIWLHEVKKMSLEVRNKDESTPLMLATANGRHDVMRWLLEKKVDLQATNKKKETAYTIAKFYNHTSVINILFPYYEPSVSLPEQSKANNAPTTSIAPQAGAVVTPALSPPPSTTTKPPKTYTLPPALPSVIPGEKRIDLAIRSAGRRKVIADNSSTTSESATNEDYDTELPLAAEKQNKKEKPVINTTLPVLTSLPTTATRPLTSTPGSNNKELFAAAEKGDLERVKILTPNEASLTATDDEGYTALHIAAARGHLPIVKYFIEEKGISVKTRTASQPGIFTETIVTGYTVIQIAAAFGNLPIVKYFINERGFDPEEDQGEEDGSFLEWAATCEYVSIREYIAKERPPKVTVKDKNICTPPTSPPVPTQSKQPLDENANARYQSVYLDNNYDRANRRKAIILYKPEVDEPTLVMASADARSPSSPSIATSIAKPAAATPSSPLKTIAPAEQQPQPPSSTYKPSIPRAPSSPTLSTLPLSTSTLPVLPATTTVALSISNNADSNVSTSKINKDNSQVNKHYFDSALQAETNTKKANPLATECIDHIRAGNLVHIHSLIMKGLSIHHCFGETGITLLHLAVASGHLHVVQYFIEHGANKNVKTTLKQTPTDIANASKFTTITDYLSLPAAVAHQPIPPESFILNEQSLKSIPPIAPDALKEEKEIGRGGMGIVYKGTYQDKTVAIKKSLVPEDDQMAKEDLQREALIVFNCKSPYIVQCYGASVLNSPYRFVLEFMEGGNLSNMLLSNPPVKMSSTLRYKIAIDVGKGLLFLHNYANVIYADLKSDNVLLDANGNAKLADFGIAKVKEKTALHNRSVLVVGEETGGTPDWKAPEVLYGHETTRASDIFSLAILLWQLWAREKPLKDKNYSNSIQRLKDVDEKGLRPTIVLDTPKYLAMLIPLCWMREPGQRPPIEEVLAVMLQEFTMIESKNVMGPDAYFEQFYFEFLIARIKDNDPLVKNLDFRNTKIPDKYLIALFNALESNCTVISLHLGHNKLNATATVALGNALTKNRTLTALHIPPLDDLDTLLKSIKRNNSLVVVSLTTTNPKQESKIKKYLQRNQRDQDKCFRAVAEGDLLQAHELFKKGVSMHAPHRDSGMTPIHVAAESGHVSLVQYLVEHGVETKSLNKGGDYPISLAIRNKHQAVVNYLRSPLAVVAIPFRNHRVKAKDISLQSVRSINAVELKPDDDRLLGVGSFGQVFRGKYYEQAVAVKILKKDATEAATKSFKREARIMSQLKSAYIIQCYGANFEKAPFMIALELMEGGTLTKLLTNNVNKFDWKDLTSFAIQIAKAIRYLHMGGITHGDIKPDNILVSADKKAVKLADFGISKFKLKPSLGQTVVATGLEMRGGGTPCWMAPEILKGEITPQGGKDNSHAPDIYSYGLILCYLGTKEEPFKDKVTSHFDLTTKVLNGERPSPAPDMPKGIAKIMRLCWETKPEARPSMDDNVVKLEVENLTLNKPGVK